MTECSMSIFHRVFDFGYGFHTLNDNYFTMFLLDATGVDGYQSFTGTIDQMIKKAVKLIKDEARPSKFMLNETNNAFVIVGVPFTDEEWRCLVDKYQKDFRCNSWVFTQNKRAFTDYFWTAKDE